MTGEAIGARLAALYCGIEATAMRNAPICNAALRVEAIGFRSFSRFAVGIVVTPWFLNLVAAEQRDGEAPLLSAHALRLRFPAGEIDFTVTEMSSFGHVASCSLFSPMDDFPDQESARAVARAALVALFDPHLHAENGEAAPRKALDRRAFLGRGRLQPVSPS
ncbi:MAG TPA: [NiFe]-hydrogenase assembly chaperone HybE [Methylocystis sp.]|nr:[NiFe]-hydrogenase assembly chaperone HybE [Methylocystis sp.]